MTISAVVTETEINASVTQLSNSVALTETEINASVSQTPISANVSSSPVSASVTAGTTISVAVSQTNISASISSSGGGVTDHALLTNLSYALSGHTGFQATLTADIDYLTPGTAALTYQPILTFPLTPDLGGTGIANLAGSTLTLGGATTISTGGTIALGGYTLTVPASLTPAGLAIANVFTTTQTVTPGTDVVGQIINVSATADTFQVKSGANVLSGFGADGRLFSSLGTDTSNFFIGPGAGNLTMTALAVVAIGQTAGASLTTGNYNMLIGNQAGNALQDGNNNTFIGRNSGSLNVSGVYNTGIGGGSLQKATSSYNVSIGSNSMQDSTSGARNTCIGYAAMGDSITGDFNTIIGFASGQKIAGGNYNLAIGYQSGGLLTSGDNNVFLGYSAGYRQTTSGSLLIIDNAQRASAAVEAENAFLYGSMAAGGYLQLNIPTTTNNAVKDTLKLQAYVSTASTGAAVGFGVGLPFYAETATDGTYQQQGLISTSWIDATNVTRKAKLSLSAYDTATRLGLEIEADGSAAKLGFYGVTTVARQVLATGAGATADDIITALQNLGLVKQS